MNSYNTRMVEKFYEFIQYQNGRKILLKIPLENFLTVAIEVHWTITNSFWKPS